MAESSTSSTAKRAWLSILTSVSFAVIGLTGVLMFFHVRAPGTTWLHEFGGILFVVVAILHLKLNWRAWASYCGQRTGRIALCVGIVAMASLFAIGLGHESEHRGPHGPGRGGPGAGPQTERPCMQER